MLIKRKHIHFTAFTLFVFTMFLFGFTLTPGGGRAEAKVEIDVGDPDYTLTNPYEYSASPIIMGGEGDIGVQARNGAVVNIDTSVTTTGDNSFGAKTQHGTIHITGSIEVWGETTYGVWVSPWSEASGTIQVDKYITAEGAGVTGAYAGYGGIINVGESIKVSGYKATAVETVHGSQTNVSKDVKAYGEGAYGLDIWDDSLVIVDGTVLASGDNSIALRLDKSNATVSGDISAIGTGAKGVYSTGESGIVNAQGNVEVYGDNSFAVDVGYEGQANVSNNVKAYGIGARGLNVEGKSLATVDGNILTSGDKSVAVRAVVDGKATVNGYVFAEGAEAKGVYARDSDSIINVKESIEVFGDKAIGVDIARGSQVNVSKDITATGVGVSAVAVSETGVARVDGNVFAAGEGSIAIHSANNGSVTVSEDVSVRGDKSKAVIASKSSVFICGNVYASDGSSVEGVAASNNSVVNIDGNVVADGTDSTLGVSASNSTVTIGGDVNVNGDNSTGLRAESSGNIYIGGDEVNVYGDGSTALNVKTGGNIYLNNTRVWVEEDSYLLNGNQSGNVYAKNGSQLFGDTVNSRGNFNMTLEGGSSLSGSVNDMEANAVTSLTLSGADDVWNVTESSLMNGTLVNNGRVDYGASALGTEVTVGNLGGGGDALFVMKTDIVSQTNDKLVVEGTTEGSYTIAALNDGSAAATGREELTLVETADQEGSFALTNNIELGAWIYSLRQTVNGDGALWKLYASDVSDVASGAINTFAGAYLLGYVETQTLIKRLGDLRDTPHLSGLWFKAHGGKFESDAKSFVKEFDMDYWGVQLGYDRKLDIGWHGDTYAGIMFGYSKGDLDFANDAGSGEAKSKMVGVYGTYIADNGFYADAVLKYQWIDNEFNSHDTQGVFVNGDDVTTGGFGASLEVGQRIFFVKDKASGWYAEPQIQLSYMRYDGDYYQTSNGMRIGTDDFTSVIGRVGMLIGYETEKASFYAKVSKEKEFKGTVDIYANGAHVAEEDFGDDWWTYGLGFTSRVNDRNSVYLDIERSSGGSFTQKWAVKGGWRVLF